MKKMSSIILLAVFFTQSLKAQKIAATKVPSDVKTSFAKTYPATPVKWEKEGDKYEASFKENGNSMSALIAVDGTITEVEMDIKVAALPAAAAIYIKNNYKDVSAKGASKITKANGSVNYEAEIRGKDVLFDEAGNYIKTTKD